MGASPRENINKRFVNRMKFLLHIILTLFMLIPSLAARDKVVKISGDLEVLKISENSYIHISYYDFSTYKHCPANGLIYLNKGKAYIIDTPWTEKETENLINWVTNHLKATIEGVVSTHWHIDCMGGLKVIHNAGIKSYAHYLTVEIAGARNLPVPRFSFKDSLTLKLADKKIICRYFGPAHTIDNIVAWIPGEKILFGGCMLKALNWNSLGFTGDADVKEWPATLKKVLESFPGSKIVIPGHGKYGDLGLVHHTIQLARAAGAR